jgi:hypothetical protein
MKMKYRFNEDDMRTIITLLVGISLGGSASMYFMNNHCQAVYEKAKQEHIEAERLLELSKRTVRCQ